MGRWMRSLFKIGDLILEVTTYFNKEDRVVTWPGTLQTEASVVARARTHESLPAS